jgi:hypothetical protein
MIGSQEVLPPRAALLSPVRVLKEIAEGPPPTFADYTAVSPQVRPFCFTFFCWRSPCHRRHRRRRRIADHHRHHHQ